MLRFTANVVDVSAAKQNINKVEIFCYTTHFCVSRYHYFMGEGIYENLLYDPPNFTLHFERSTEYIDKKNLLKNIEQQARGGKTAVMKFIAIRIFLLREKTYPFMLAICHFTLLLSSSSINKITQMRLFLNHIELKIQQ